MCEKTCLELWRFLLNHHNCSCRWWEVKRWCSLIVSSLCFLSQESWWAKNVYVCSQMQHICCWFTVTLLPALTTTTKKRCTVPENYEEMLKCSNDSIITHWPLAYPKLILLSFHVIDPVTGYCSLRSWPVALTTMWTEQTIRNTSSHFMLIS